MHLPQYVKLENIYSLSSLKLKLWVQQCALHEK